MDTELAGKWFDSQVRAGKKVIKQQAKTNRNKLFLPNQLKLKPNPLLALQLTAAKMADH